MIQGSKMTRVGIIGDAGCVQDTFAMSTKVVSEFCGSNTGNLAFRYAVSKHIASEKRYFNWNSQPEFVRENCDLLVFPAANQLHPRFNWEKQAAFVEAVNLPWLVVGLGAQAPHLGSKLELQEGTVRWIRAIAERSQLIGVRGEYTVEVLRRLGVNNTVVTGCPSNFINPSPTLGKTLERKFNQMPRRLAITDGADKGDLKQVEQKLIDWLLLHHGTYICQSPPELIALARNRLDEVSTAWLKWFHKYLLPRVSYDEFLSFIRQYFRVFFNVDAWLEFLGTVDLTLGTRMHGNMLSIQAGTPGICIHHDSRTQELCEAMLIPHVSTEKFLTAQNPQELIELTRFDANAFDRNRLKLAREYKTVLVQSGVRLSQQLESLAAAEGVEGKVTALPQTTFVTMSAS